MKKIIILPILLLLLGFSCTTNSDWLKLEQDKLKLESDKEQRLSESEIFDRKITCQNMVDKFKERYDNVTGGYYNGDSLTCSIEYKVKGEKQNSDMQFMSDN